MRRLAQLLTFAFLALALVGAITGVLYQSLSSRQELSESPSSGERVDVGGYFLHLVCMGAGSPTVVLDGGTGATAASWALVQPTVAEDTRVCSYDRAGMGHSDPGPRPRRAGLLADELATLLSRSSIEGGPVVLVGASAAGFTVRLLATQYPELVAGLVLVDASHEEQRTRLAAVGASDSLPRWILRAAPLLAALGIPRAIGISVATTPLDRMPSDAQHQLRATQFQTSTFHTTADELLSMNESMAQVSASRRELNIPVVVVSRGRGSRGEQVEGVWGDLQRDQLSLSSLACQVIAERSGHGIPFEQPEAVVGAILRISNIIRSETSSLPDEWCRED